MNKQLKLESRGFRYKAALYLRYLQINLDDEIRREFVQISSIISQWPASKDELAPRLAYICS